LTAQALCLAATLAAHVETRVDAYGDRVPEGAIQRLGTARLRYGVAKVRPEVVYSRDGKRALVTFRERLEVWDLSEGKCIGSHAVSGKLLRTVTCNRDGTLALVADNAGTALEWDLQEQKVTHQFPTGRRSLASVRYSPDEGRILTLDKGTSTVEEWDRATGKRQIAIGASEPSFTHAIYCRDGATALVAHWPRGNNILHYDLRTGKLLKSFLRDYCVYDMTLSADGERLLVGSRHRASEWRLADYKCLRTFTGHHGHAAPSVAYARNDRHLLTGSRDGSVRLWDRTAGKLIRRWFPHQRYVLRMRVSPDGQWLLSYGGDRTIAETNLETGRPRLQWNRHRSAVKALAISPDGSKLCSGSADGTIRVWVTADWKATRVVKNPGGEVHCLAISPDGKRILAGAKDGRLRESDLTTGKLTGTLTGHRGYVRAVAYLGSGDRALSAADDGSLRLWGTNKKAVLRTMTGHLGAALSLAVSADDEQALSGGRDGTVREWDLETGTLLHTTMAHRGWVEAVDYRPDGARVVSAGRDGMVREWDREKWQMTRELKHGEWVYAAQYVSDGKCIVSGGQDDRALLWEAETGKVLKALEGHEAPVRALAGFPAGKWLASGSEDTTVLIWGLP